MSKKHSDSTSSDDGGRLTGRGGGGGGFAAKGPGGIGSYLARQEFGGGGGALVPNQDSGYASRGSGGGYPKVDLAVNQLNLSIIKQCLYFKRSLALLECIVISISIIKDNLPF